MPAVFGKRLDGVHGQRHDSRDPALVPVVFTTLLQGGPAAMTNISRTGAKVADLHFGREGDEAMIQVAGLSLMGTIMWVEGNSCGVQFDSPLDDRTVDILQENSVLIPRSPMTPEEQLAINDWQNGWSF